eukprot:TRINITY_DN10771_c0_g1_i1.p1 TRINITY_DN10771_c0_g1~~TRINITY_DN10771_c0_g1_i1.p1  ORF type:complete len:255 (-),score=73.35 TRINITY_DN10771_c0_g1_i1:48-812(-)
MSSAINKSIEQIQEKNFLARLSKVGKSGKLESFKNHFDEEYRQACQKAREKAISNFLKEKKRKRKKDCEGLDEPSESPRPKKKRKTKKASEKTKKQKKKKEKKKEKKKTKKRKKKQKKKAEVIEEEELTETEVEEVNKVKQSGGDSNLTLNLTEEKIQSNFDNQNLVKEKDESEQTIKILDNHVDVVEGPKSISLEELEAQKREAELRQKALTVLMNKLKQNPNHNNVNNDNLGSNGPVKRDLNKRIKLDRSKR